MKRLVLFLSGVLALPLSAAAQAVPVPPAAPNPAPVVAPAARAARDGRPAVSPSARLAPAPHPVIAVPDLGDLRFDFVMPDVPDVDTQAIEMAMDAARARIDDMRASGAFEAIQMSDDQREQVREQARAAADQARAVRDQARVSADSRVTFTFSSSGGGLYNEGLNALQQRQYDRAVAAFDRVVAQKAARTDGALYWMAFAQSRMARNDDALTTLATLRRDFPQSRYLNDAKVLEADVRRTSGQPVNIEAMNANEEIKLLAISGIADTDPDKAIPLLQGVLDATNSPAVKKRAIYVLALSNDERAHQLLLRYAKGGGNPDLQAEAIRYLASRRDRPTTTADLKQIYDSTQEPDIRRAIIDAYRSAGDKSALLAIAGNRNENADLRRSALGSLSNLASPQELWTLYQSEPDAALRAQIVNAFRSIGAEDQLTQIAKTDADMGVRQRAIRGLGERSREHAAPLLLELYGSQSDPEVKKTIISTLGDQNQADALVTLARKENNIELKRDIVRRLSELAPKNKVAADALMEMLK